MKRLIATLLLLASPAWAAMEFNGSTDKATGALSNPSIATPPFSLCCWFKVDSATAQHGLLSLGDSAGTVNWFALQAAGHQAGDPVGATATTTTQGNAFSSTGFSTGTWHHGCAVFTSTSSRTAYIDGGSAVTNTDLVAPTSIDDAGIGTIKRSTDCCFTDGQIAECGWWTNYALSAAEVATLAKGYAPPCVARANLGDYWPMVRDATALADLFSAPEPLTLTGGTVVSHPRITNCQ